MTQRTLTPLYYLRWTIGDTVYWEQMECTLQQTKDVVYRVLTKPPKNKAYWNSVEEVEIWYESTQADPIRRLFTDNVYRVIRPKHMQTMRRPKPPESASKPFAAETHRYNEEIRKFVVMRKCGQKLPKAVRARLKT